MRRGLALAALATATSLLAGAARGGDAPPAPRPAPGGARGAAARAGLPDGVVLALPPAAGGDFVAAVRVERQSEIAVIFDHLAAAEPKEVLLGPSPSPEIGRMSVVSGAATLLSVTVSERGFRVPIEAGKAFSFRSPGALAWLFDRLSAPDRTVLPGAPEGFDLEAAIAALSAKTGRAGAADGGPQDPLANLVVNGGFEEEITGKGSPVGWDRVDGLTTFWSLDAVDPKAHGHVIGMDTDVYESEWKRRREEMAKDPDSPPWAKTPVPESDQYATVGGNHGVSFYCDPIPVSPGQAYRLNLDARAEMPGGGTAKVWVRGYADLKSSRGVEERRIFDALTTMRMGSSSWTSWTMAFHPTKNTPSVTRMRVMLYGYWPRGGYAFDNVSIRPISDAEYAHAKATERVDVK